MLRCGSDTLVRLTVSGRVTVIVSVGVSVGVGAGDVDVGANGCRCSS